MILYGRAQVSANSMGLQLFVWQCQPNVALPQHFEAYRLLLALLSLLSLLSMLSVSLSVSMSGQGGERMPSSDEKGSQRSVRWRLGHLRNFQVGTWCLVFLKIEECHLTRVEVCKFIHWNIKLCQCLRECDASNNSEVPRRHSHAQGIVWFAKLVYDQLVKVSGCHNVSDNSWEEKRKDIENRRRSCRKSGVQCSETKRHKTQTSP